MPLSIPRVGKKIRKQCRKALRLWRQHIDLYVRDKSLRRVERFVFSWVLVFVLGVGIVMYQHQQLGSYYLTDGARPGGQFVEGVVGEANAINPVFAGNRVSRVAERLVFQSLFRYNGGGELVPELARDYNVNDAGDVYTVSLRRDAKWHDGQSVTAEDVAFTFRTIQNPNTGSSLQPAWQDIEIQTLDAYTIQFSLPNAFTPFLHQLTTGIVPAHVLRNMEPSQLRVAGFNRAPVGSGPFMFDEISNQRIHLEASSDGPRLDEFKIAMYSDRGSMVDAYSRGELSAMVTGSAIDTSSLPNQERSRVQKINTPSQVFAFFNTERISKATVRRALTRGIDNGRLVDQMGGEFETAHGPLLPEHPGYISAQLTHNREKARTLLDEAGWTRTEDDLRQRDGETLSIDIVTQEKPHYTAAAKELSRQWEQLGVKTEVRTAASTRLQEDYIRPRSYDVLLFGVAIGSDPDVYAYWHSSQISGTGRNLSQYESMVADSSLEDGRTRADTKLRAAKYQTFQKEWRNDAPAAALYRLHDYYIWRREARGIRIDNIAHTIDRFYNVEDWTIRTRPVLRRLQE
jgi:peptide/nickel transport system substrate-binding protein